MAEDRTAAKTGWACGLYLCPHQPKCEFREPTDEQPAATTDPARGQERIRCRSVLLRDLDTLDLEPIGMIFEQRDRTARVEFFEAAAERDPHLSKLRREFESFDRAVSAWHRSALLCAPTGEDFLAR